jgi:hypothetical protein
MKASKLSWGLTGVAAICSLALYLYVFSLQGKLNASVLDCRLLEAQNRLLKDQVFELEAKRTYEEGLSDGLVRSGQVGYQDGYHAAITQMAEQKQLEEQRKEFEKSRTQTPAEEKLSSTQGEKQ